MMHTLVMDLQKIIHAVWVLILDNARMIAKVGTDDAIPYTANFAYADASINMIYQYLHAACQGQSLVYESPVSTWSWFNERRTRPASEISVPVINLLASSSQSSSASTVTGSTGGKRAAASASSSSTTTSSAKLTEEVIKRRKALGIIKCNGKPVHFNHQLGSHGNKIMCSNHAFEGYHCKHPEGRCPMAHVNDINKLNANDKSAMVAWVNQHAELSFLPGKGPTRASGKN